MSDGDTDTDTARQEEEEEEESILCVGNKKKRRRFVGKQAIPLKLIKDDPKRRRRLDKSSTNSIVNGIQKNAILTGKKWFAVSFDPSTGEITFVQRNWIESTEFFKVALTMGLTTSDKPKSVHFCSCEKKCQDDEECPKVEYKIISK